MARPTAGLALPAGVWAAASVAADNFRNSSSPPGIESQQAADLLAEHGVARQDTVPPPKHRHEDMGMMANFDVI